MFIIAAVGLVGLLQAQTPEAKKTTNQKAISKEVKTEKHVTKTGTEVKKVALKDHVCTPACKNGKHVYKHGEKGHVCTKECKDKMEKKGNNQVKEMKTTKEVKVVKK